MHLAAGVLWKLFLSTASDKGPTRKANTIPFCN